MGTTEGLVSREASGHIYLKNVEDVTKEDKPGGIETI